MTYIVIQGPARVGRKFKFLSALANSLLTSPIYQLSGEAQKSQQGLLTFCKICVNVG